MLVRKYEMPWRKAYEGYAAAIWFAAACLFAYESLRTTRPVAVTLALLAICAAMAVFRLAQSVRLIKIRASLCGRAMEVVSFERFWPSD